MNQIESIWKSRSYCLSCSLCCKNTEMVLTPSDIERIGEHGFKKEDFIEIVDGFFKLKNVEGHCVFLREGRCMIYSYRPIGCSLYPIVIEVDTGDITLDYECPLAATTTLEEFSKARRFAQLILEELSLARNYRK